MRVSWCISILVLNLGTFLIDFVYIGGGVFILTLIQVLYTEIYLWYQTDCFLCPIVCICCSSFFFLSHTCSPLTWSKSIIKHVVTDIIISSFSSPSRSTLQTYFTAISTILRHTRWSKAFNPSSQPKLTKPSCVLSFSLSLWCFFPFFSSYMSFPVLIWQYPPHHSVPECPELTQASSVSFLTCRLQ